MQDSDLMLQVSGDDLKPGQPVPYDIYTAEGALMMSKGQMLSDPQQFALVETVGWHIVPEGEPAPLEAVTREEAMKTVYPDDIRLPERPMVPVHMAEVLIADDMKLIRQLLSRMLREKGITKIEEADNGRRAVSSFFRFRPHIVFLDIDMPGIDGLAVLKQIKKWSPETFVCMITANSTMMNVKEAKEQGVDGFLVKPVNALNMTRILNMYTKREKAAK